MSEGVEVRALRARFDAEVWMREVIDSDVFGVFGVFDVFGAFGAFGVFGAFEDVFEVEGFAGLEVELELVVDELDGLDGLDPGLDGLPSDGLDIMLIRYTLDYRVYDRV